MPNVLHIVNDYDPALSPLPMQFLIYFKGYLFIADRPFGLNLYLGGNLPSHFFIVNTFYLFREQGKPCTKFASG